MQGLLDVFLQSSLLYDNGKPREYVNTKYTYVNKLSSGVLYYLQLHNNYLGLYVGFLLVYRDE